MRQVRGSIPRWPRFASVGQAEHTRSGQSCPALQKSRSEHVLARNGAQMTLRASQTGQVGPAERVARPGARGAHGVRCEGDRQRRQQDYFLYPGPLAPKAWAKAIRKKIHSLSPETVAKKSQSFAQASRGLYGFSEKADKQLDTIIGALDRIMPGALAMGEEIEDQTALVEDLNDELEKLDPELRRNIWRTQKIH